MNAARCRCLATRNPLVILAFCLPFKSLPSVRTDLLHSGLQVEFERPVDAKGNIETWLQRLVDGMQDTVKQVSINSSECMHACTVAMILSCWDVATGVIGAGVCLQTYKPNLLCMHPGDQACCAQHV